MDALNFVAWNVRDLINKELEICIELKQAGLNIIVVTETNKKLKGTKGNGDHLMTCSTIPH